ncbi:MAG: hypothetical protein RIM23_21825 [Coleofasciculus sp. G3-WIS-01]
MANRTIIKAVLYDFGIIGEAARNIPPEIPLRTSALTSASFALKKHNSAPNRCPLITACYP